MTRKELIDHLEHLAEYVKYSEDAPALREVIEMLKCSEMPNGSEERTEERTKTHACDLIKRQDAINAINHICPTDTEYDCTLLDRVDVTYVLSELPPAQPEVRTQMSSADCISRQAAIFIASGYCHPANIAKELEKLPSAQPEQRWIPCSERLPDEHEWIGTKKFGTTISNEVYVTFEVPDGQRFAEHINFQNGKLSPVDEQRMKVWFKGAKPIAWMPLPSPYQAERREE